MKLKQLFTDDSAVSPVIGVILMVAITVILAAVIGSFVLNLGGSLQQSAPQASFGFDYEDGPYNVTVTHESGDQIEASQLNVTTSGEFTYTNSNTFEDVGGTISAGDSATYNNTGNDTQWDGETIRVTWNSENGENSATLSTSTAPS